MGARMLRQELALGEGFLEERDGRLVAYLLRRREGGLQDILRLGVHPSYRRQGLAAGLLRHALQGPPTTILTVQKDNLAALRLYRGHGFEVAGHLHAAGAWVMRLTQTLEG